MKKKKSVFLTVLIVLMLSMMWTFPVLADEGEPQSEEPTVTETTPVDETAGEGEPLAVEEEPVSEEPVASEPAPEPAPASEGETLLEQLPENTTVVVTDESGDPIPLVTQEAAEAVATMPDPQWCPVGAAPGAATCSGVKTSFNGVGGLIEWLTINNPAKAGVIWVEASYNSTTAGDVTAIVLDGSVLTNMALQALTINGGWTGTGSTLNPNDQSEFNVPFLIDNWTGAVTLNNLLITGASGFGLSALEVRTDGNIIANNVDVVNNTTQNGGAYLDNIDDPAAKGNVTVNDSTFNGNTGINARGLNVWTSGMVTIKNITANENTGTGLSVNNAVATRKVVTLTGSNQFMGNGLDGVYIESKGIITLSNITAEGNGLNGAFLYNDFTGITNGVVLKGASLFNNNGWNGLYIQTNGSVTLANITANDNGWDPGRAVASDWDPDPVDTFYGYDAAGKGAFINNWTSTSPKGITLTGVNTFNGNASTGLLVSTTGLLTVSNLTANDNGCDAAFEGSATNYFCAGAFLEGAGVTVTGYGNFSGNTYKGLSAKNSYVEAIGDNVGAVTLNNIYAEGNGGSGAVVDTYGAKGYNVTLLGINTFLDNGGDGLNVFSYGAVVLSNITANENVDFGAYVDNTSATTAKAVTFTGIGTYIGNGNGIWVNSKGAITTNGLTILNSTGTGINLDNCIDLTTPGICQASANQTVNINGVNTISNNGASGLIISSRGAVTISSLTTVGNALRGVAVTNQFTNALGGVTFKNYLNSFNNGTIGVEVFSKGAVSLINVQSNSNGNSGVFIDNADINTLQSNVSITGTNSFSYNGDGGLKIYTYGTVTLNNVFANGNTEFGALIDNYLSDAIAAKGVTLTGLNFFNSNQNQSGLTITSLGAITVNKITANFNGGDGVYLDNRWNKVSQSVSFVGYGIFNGNGTRGLEIYSNGNITMANLTANNNTNNGVQIYNNSLTTTPQATALSVNVTLSGTNNFFHNGSSGLGIWSDGVVTLNNITASNNSEHGLYVDNVSAIGSSAGKGLTLNGWNNFMRNGNTGLYFNISGNVVLNRVVSSYNGDGAGPNTAHGINGASSGTISITCAALSGNEGTGYILSAPSKTITLKGVFSYANGLTDSAVGTPVTVSRSCTLP